MVMPQTAAGVETGRFESTRTELRRPGSRLRLVQPIRESALRAPRVLSHSQREALNQMIGLGARLDDAFTMQELRSEFRALARVYHPDRHQARRAAAQQAASSFVALRRAYDILKAAA